VFAANRERMQQLVAELRERTNTARLGGGPKYWRVIESREASGPRAHRPAARPWFPFLELSALAADGIYDNEAPGAGLVTGIGRVSGREVVVVANDATVKGGTYFPITVKKHIRAQQVALENRLPASYLVDSGGAFLPLQAGVPGPRTLRRISSIRPGCRPNDPADCRRHGILHGRRRTCRRCPTRPSSSTAPERSSWLVRSSRPRRERRSRPKTSAAPTSTRGSGVADYFADDDAHALVTCRTIVSTLNTAKQLPADDNAGGSEITTRPSSTGSSTPTAASRDVHEVIARLVDGSRFDEFKARHGPTLVTGFARLHGFLVGIIASNGVLFSESALKATHFIEMCNLRIPHIPGTSRASLSAGMNVRESRKTARRWCTRSRTPSCRSSPSSSEARSGAGNYGMCGRAYDPRLLWMWPNARISVMGGEQAAES
jgi:acetyl-CoA carboxylase carboxyltransferase component